MLTDIEFVRYQRQVALAEIGESGQIKLANSHILIIGCGGLGSAASLYLAAAGVGKLVVVDDDVVELSNLHRQVVYRHDDLEKTKVSAMAQQVAALNPQIQVRTIAKRLDAEQLQLEVMLADVVLDCSDNMPTRQKVNQVCVEQKTALITSAAIGWQGQFAVFDYHDTTNRRGCYRCLFPFDELEQAQKCSQHGVVGPVVGTLGNYQAIAAIQKLATGKFYVETERLHIFDGLTLQWQSVMVSRDPSCDVCGNRHQPIAQHRENQQ